VEPLALKGALDDSNEIGVARLARDLMGDQVKFESVVDLKAALKRRFPVGCTRAEIYVFIDGVIRRRPETRDCLIVVNNAATIRVALGRILSEKYPQVWFSLVFRFDDENRLLYIDWSMTSVSHPNDFSET